MRLLILLSAVGNINYKSKSLRTAGIENVSQTVFDSLTRPKAMWLAMNTAFCRYNVLICYFIIVYFKILQITWILVGIRRSYKEFFPFFWGTASMKLFMPHRVAWKASYLQYYISNRISSDYPARSIPVSKGMKQRRTASHSNPLTCSNYTWRQRATRDCGEHVRSTLLRTK